MVYLITYDLKSPNDTSVDYSRVINGIKENFGTWCHLEKSVWLVQSAQDAAAIRDLLIPYILFGDALFVARLSGNWASRSLTSTQNKWIHDRPF
jgi:hypothetical protein